MYIKNQDHKRPSGSWVKAHLRLGQFAGPCCSGGLGLDGISFLDTTSTKSLSQRNARNDALLGPNIPQRPFHWAQVWDRSLFPGNWPITRDGSEAHAATRTTPLRPKLDSPDDVRKAIKHGTLHTRAQLVGVYVDKSKVTRSAWDGSSGRPSLREHEVGHLKIAEVAAQRETAELGKIEEYVIGGGSEVEALNKIRALIERTNELYDFVNAKYDRETVHGTAGRPQTRWLKAGHITREFNKASELKDKKPEQYARQAKRLGVKIRNPASSKQTKDFSCVRPRLQSFQLGSATQDCIRVPIAGKPTPCTFYTIKSGIDKNGLIDLAGRAYGTQTNRTELAQWINNHPYNRRFWRADLANKNFPQGRISFSPGFSRDISRQAEATGKAPSGRAFATIFIPPPPTWLQKSFPSCSVTFAR
jgi:hypothetical protein